MHLNIKLTFQKWFNSSNLLLNYITLSAESTFTLMMTALLQEAEVGNEKYDEVFLEHSKSFYASAESSKSTFQLK